MSEGLDFEALLADEDLRRREFPVAGRVIYLAHAAVGPLPARVAAAIAGYAARAAETGQFEHLHKPAEDSARSLAAAMLGASADEIAFVPSTSAGLSLVAAGLPWRDGDSVVIAEGDFPANVYPWLGLERRGVRVRRIPKNTGGLITKLDVLSALDERTRLVSLSSVHFSTGAAIDVDAIGALLHERGVLFCVDAIQSLGALPISARHVDFLAADAHKWLLGPQGIGVLFVRRERFSELYPALLGWKSVRADRDYGRAELELKDDARRYEPGNLNALGLVGLAEALSILQAVGVPRIAERLRHLRSILVRGLLDRNFCICVCAAGTAGGGEIDAHPMGITSFYDPAEDMAALHKRLLAEGIVVSLRADPTGRFVIRVAPHFYSTEAEIQALLKALRR
jgi:selenocysteine lyase/cysteine desulfurase